MPRNDSQRESHNRYESKTYTVVGAKLHKADAAKLKQLLAKEGLASVLSWRNLSHTKDFSF